MAKILKFNRKENARSHIFYFCSLMLAVTIGAGAGNLLYDHKDALINRKTLFVASAKKSFTNVAKAAISCNIKGNISINTGERIYHVPGQKYYTATRILPRYGERYFCSEAEARRAGWRKSKI